MTHLYNIRKKRTSDKSSELRLMLFLNDEKINAILVVEGQEDSAIYTNAINTTMPDISARAIVCEGKDRVLYLRRYCLTKFPNDKKTMFFIDRDHDDFLNLDHEDERTYVTDYYSIEWNVCTEEVLISLISRHYTLSNQDPIRDKACKKFRDLMEVWINHSKHLMHSVVAARRKGERLKLENIPLSKICRFNNGSLVHTGNTSRNLLSQARCENIPSEEDIAKCKNELSNCDIRLYIRGKFAVHFFCDFFQNLNDICGRPKKIDDGDLKTGVHLGKNIYIFNIFSMIGPSQIHYACSLRTGRLASNHEFMFSIEFQQFIIS